MLRQLLTVLAILTGLVAGAPTQAARASDVASVRLVAPAELSAKCAMPSAGPAFAASLTPLKDAAKAPCPRPRPPIVLPPVMLGSDRALE